MWIFSQSVGAKGTQKGKPPAGTGQDQRALGESSSEGEATGTSRGKFKLQK